jgi:hypothetical protein
MKESKAKLPKGLEATSNMQREALRKSSNRERQRRYRENALKDPDGLLFSRLQVMISVHADCSLGRLCKATGKTKREIVEQALVELEKRYSVTI